MIALGLALLAWDASVVVDVADVQEAATLAQEDAWVVRTALVVQEHVMKHVSKRAPGIAQAVMELAPVVMDLVQTVVLVIAIPRVVRRAEDSVLDAVHVEGATLVVLRGATLNAM